jgi:hypothetical protein
VVAACTMPDCPPGDVIFFTQAEIEQFATDYPFCTVIAGKLQIGDSDSAVRANNDITDLTKLARIATIHESLVIAYNDSLVTLNGLSGLDSVGAGITIQANTALSDISDLQNTTYFYNLSILGNPALDVCNLPNFCTYIAKPATTHPRAIVGNLTNCLNEQAVKSACGIVSVSEIGIVGISVYPNPVKSTLYFSDEVSSIRITDVLGRTVVASDVVTSSIKVASLPSAVYIVTVTTKEGSTISTKIIKE